MRSSDQPVRPYLALSTLCVGFFLLMMDTTIVNVAIPTIQRDLAASLNDIVWVNSAYLLTYVVPLLLMGRLGDWVGRKPVFLAGMAVFTSASLGCALAGTPSTLIAARAVQGLGAAAMSPQMIALITVLFDETRRGRAMGIWSGTGPVAAALAPIVGGASLEAGGWQWIFLINLPVGAAGLALAVRALPGQQRRPSAPPDVIGAVLSGLGLFAVVLFVQNGEQYHWGQVVGPVHEVHIAVAGVLLLGAFVAWQHRRAATALVPLGLFRRASLRTSAVVVLMIGVAWSGMFLPLTLLLQSAMHLSPLRAGLTMMPQALTAAVIAPIAGRLVDRTSSRMVIVAAAAVFGVGLAVVALAAGAGANALAIVTGVVLCGIGTGSVFPALAASAVCNLPPELLGAAAGVYNTARQVGIVLGSAAVGVLLQVEVRRTPALTAAVHDTLLLPLAAVVVALVVALALRRRADGASVDDSAATPAFTGRNI